MRSLAKARSCMILEARSASRRWTTVTLVGELGEEERLFHGGVTAPDDGDLLAAEEEPVARGTRRQPVAQKAISLSRPSISDCAPVETMTASAGTSSSPTQTVNGRAEKSTPVTLAVRYSAPEALGLVPEAHHQVGAHDPVGEAGVVLDVGGQHELTAGLVGGGRRLALDDQRREVGAGGVDGSGRARPGPIR